MALPAFFSPRQVNTVDWLNPGLQQAGIGQAPERNIIFRDQPASQFAKSQRGFDGTSSLRPSSGDKRFRACRRPE
jgi:hypothetical protein